LNSSYSNLTIIGEYGQAVFDGESKSRIFTLSGNNITLKNIEFKNGKTDVGGAIANYGNNNKVMNSSFNNNSANPHGGAIYNEGSNFNIDGSHFNNNSATNGGAISNFGDDFNIIYSNFNNNSATNGGAICNMANNLSVINSSFTNNNASSGGVIWTNGDNNSILSSNIYDNYNSINITGANNAIIKFNRFVNNTNTIIGAGNDDNLSSNWWGQNTGITGFINNGADIDYILDDYFVLFLRYSPNGSGTVVNSSFNLSKGNYILLFDLTLNASTYNDILNETAILLPDFNKTIVINNGTDNNRSTIESNGFSSEALPLHYNNKKIAIRALVDNEDIELSLLLNTPDYSNGLYVNGSWNDSNGDGSSWDSPFLSLNLALQAIIDNGLNSSNWNFIIHIAGDLSSKSYTGNGVNVNLTLNSSYSNLTIRGEYGYTVFDGEYLYSIFNIAGSNITLDKIKFINAKNSNGGAIYSTGNDVSVLNSIFINNTAIYGGGIFNTGKNITILNSNFSNNSAHYGGGAIGNYGGSFATFNSIFMSNFAVYDGGGAIFNDGGDFNLCNSSFMNNSAIYGGVVYNTMGNFSVSNSSFNNNSANLGGVVYNNMGNFSASNSSFMNNFASFNGGAINNNINSGFIVSNSIFMGNFAVYGGGAIENNGDGLCVFNSSFMNNFVDYNGGAIENYGANSSVSNSIFVSNSAIGDGGAIYNWYGANFSVVNSSFTQNNASHGGVIHNTGDNLSVLNSIFKNSFASKGGVIYNDGGLGFSIMASIFEDNFANNGGAIDNLGILDINSSKFISNIAYNGGAISNYRNMSIMGSEFINNSAVRGSAIFINGNGSAGNLYQDSFVNITYNTFVNNTNNTIVAENIGSLYINYNRIYDMDSRNIAVNVSVVGDYNLMFVNLDYNWWGDNIPDTNFNGLNNYFVVNMIKNNLTNYLYIIRLNGSNDASIFENKLPRFNGAIYLDYGNGLVFDSNFNANNNQELNIDIVQIAIFAVDGWKMEISGKIVITVNNISGAKYGELILLNATIEAEDGNNSGIEVIFYINGKIIGSNITDNQGNAYYHYKVPFIGNFTFKAGNNDYSHILTNSSDINGEFIKSNSNITINFNPNGSKYGDKLILNVTLLDEYGNPLNDVNVDFYLNGKFICYGTTDSNGIAIVNYTVDFIGVYNLTVVFDGNYEGHYNYSADSDSVFGEFNKAERIINIDNVPKTVDINNKITIKGNLTDKDGNLLKGKDNLKINVTIGKNAYISDVEVVDGLWSLKINNPNIGITNVKITLDDPNYESNKEFRYTVSKIKTIITVSAPKITAAKKTNIVITLKDKYGKLLKGKNLIVKSKYLKKPFKTTTNSKGQINIRVYASNIGKYTGTVEFEGDSIYLKSKKAINQIVTGIPDLTFSKIKRIKSSNYQLAVYSVTIKNIGKGDSPKTQMYMQHWKYNGWKSKITKINIKAIGAGKSLTLTVKFLPDRGSHRTCKYQWFYINPLKNFKEISYKNNLKYLKP
ncbi:MAG: hypothetical protein LBM96_12285, partial [Methanobrevibacter sp.]|nr:hypothetical protein [Candidatus Methanoflexus mossambicus]